MEQFIELFPVLKGVPKNELCLLKKAMSIVKIPKNGLFIYPKDTLDTVYFVKKGVVREFFYENENENENTTLLLPESPFYFPSMSFSEDSKSIFYVQAIEETVLVGFEKRLLLNLANESTAVRRLMFDILERQVELMGKLRRMPYQKRADVRYQHLNTIFPGLISRAQGKYVASLLSITPSYLSTLRSNRKL